jgi:DNA-binding PadR family transcriptional regulator
MSKVKATTTTFAILGQLAWGEASTYELVKAMRANLRYMWPRAESRIYEEAKRLVDAGWATAHKRATGQRRRTVYAITAAGRAALREWLAGTPGKIALENEPLLRIFLGRHARPQELLAAVAAVSEQAEEMFAVGQDMAEQYFAGVHPRQQEVHLRAFLFDYLYGWARFNHEWAARTEREIARWSDLEPDAAKHRRALARIRSALRGE